jgi:hypothetical protein
VFFFCVVKVYYRVGCIELFIFFAILPCDQQLRLWRDVVLNQKMSIMYRCCCWSNIAFMNILFNQQLHIWLDGSFDGSFDQALQIWRDVCFWSTVAFMNRCFVFDQTGHSSGSFWSSSTSMAGWWSDQMLHFWIYIYIFWSNAALMTRCLFYQPLHFWIDTFWSNALSISTQSISSNKSGHEINHFFDFYFFSV